MSRIHLDGFLKDLQSINPKFRTLTSSLKGLVDHLTMTAATPQRMTKVEALRLCSSFRPERLAKYAPAIERLIGVWGQGGGRPYPASARGNLLNGADINRLCFRGDSRPPNEIFKIGFSKRDQSMEATYRGGTVTESLGSGPNPVLEPILGYKKAGDLDPASAVCVTPDLHVAALFPLPTITTLNNFKPTEVDTWIYMVYVASGYHTHGRQVLDAIAGLAELKELGQQVVQQNNKIIPANKVTEARVDEILQNLYGREMATDQINTKSIWYAFKISRNWTATTKKTSYTEQGTIVGYEGDYKQGGSYSVLDSVENFDAIYPPGGNWSTVAADLSQNIKNKTFAMPTHKSGFAPSSVRTLV